MKKQSMFHQSAFRMNRVAQAARALAALAAMASPGLALADMSFPSAPPMATSSAGVMPNVIIAVDGTGSMLNNYGTPARPDAPCTKGNVTDSNGNNYTFWCNTQQNSANGSEYRLYALSDALLTTFSDPTFVGKIRLAFEGTNVDAGFGPYRFNSTTTDNSMKVFTADYQTKFLQWARNLPNNRPNGAGCNPTEAMIAYAGEYLKGNWLSSENTQFVCESGDVQAPYKNFYWGGTPNFGISAPAYKADSTAAMIPSVGGDNNIGYMGSSPVPGQYLNFTAVATSPWNSNNNLRTNLTASISGGVDHNDNSVAEGADSRLACRRGYLIFMTDGGVNGNQFAPVGSGGNNNYDNSSHPLPDGSNTYNPADSDYGPLYSDYSVNNYADHTLYYWATDLTGQGAGVVSTSNTMPITTDQIVTYGGKSVKLTPYWNPQNDPATWQHMQTFTVGFGTQGGAGQLKAGDYNNPKGDQWSYTFPAAYPGGHDTSYGTKYDPVNVPIGFDSMYGNMFSLFATNSNNPGGTSSWPWVSDVDDRYSWMDIGVNSVILDLYHAAINGRGQYYPAVSVNDLSTAFKNILQSAMIQSAPGGVASATASDSRLSASGALAYAAGYTYDSAKAGNYSSTLPGWSGDGINGWIGSLTAYDASTMPTVEKWTASIPGTRQILTAKASGGIAFQWGGANLTATDGIDQATVNTVRKNPLGDIVNSQLAYVGKATRMSMDAQYANFATFANTRMSMVYVGANDGMLHGFNAGTGVEQMAYIPRGLVSRLSAFTDPGYAHSYWVDGSPFSGDAQLASPGLGVTGGDMGNWGTVLVGTLGAGGKGYFVLDVSNPASVTEGHASSAVLVDATGPEAVANDVIGYQFNAPVMDMYTSNQSAQIVKLNTTNVNGEWGIIMGNGYNSASGLPVLLIQSLSGSKPLYTISASCTAAAAGDCIAAGNGLSAPRPIDVDGNGTADIVYAGDLMGNLWKFDISDPSRNWTVAQFFKAVGPTGAAQPITSAPAVVPDAKNGGFIVAFGTGKNLVTGDQSDENLNSVYALYDHQSMTLQTQALDATHTISYIKLGNDGSAINCLSGTGPARYGCLYLQTAGSTMDAGTQHGSVTSDATSTLTDQKFAGGGSQSGWYFDIPDVDNGNAAKVLLNPSVLSGNTLLFYSINVTSATGDSGPAAGGESCTTAGKLSGAITTVNYFDLLTGNVPDNTFTIDGVPFGPEGDPGNRFRIDGVQTFIPNGSDAAQGVEANTQTESKANGPAGAQAGWRITGR